MEPISVNTGVRRTDFLPYAQHEASCNWPSHLEGKQGNWMKCMYTKALKGSLERTAKLKSAS